MINDDTDRGAMEPSARLMLAIIRVAKMDYHSRSKIRKADVIKYMNSPWFFKQCQLLGIKTKLVKNYIKGTNE